MATAEMHLRRNALPAPDVGAAVRALRRAVDLQDPPPGRAEVAPAHGTLGGLGPACEVVVIPAPRRTNADLLAAVGDQAPGGLVGLSPALALYN
jgi:hypothetical protein